MGYSCRDRATRCGCRPGNADAARLADPGCKENVLPVGFRYRARVFGADYQPTRTGGERSYPRVGASSEPINHRGGKRSDTVWRTAAVAPSPIVTCSV